MSCDTTLIRLMQDLIMSSVLNQTYSCYVKADVIKLTYNWIIDNFANGLPAKSKQFSSGGSSIWSLSASIVRGLCQPFVSFLAHFFLIKYNFNTSIHLFHVFIMSLFSRLSAVEEVLFQGLFHVFLSCFFLLTKIFTKINSFESILKIIKIKKNNKRIHEAFLIKSYDDNKLMNTKNENLLSFILLSFIWHQFY